jgi:metal-responsive CopG/Arc/MetJ family transcriptional regulator
MKTNFSTYIPGSLLEQVDQAARREDRSRSSFVRRALERAVIGQKSLEAPQAIADSADNEIAIKPR